MSDIAAVHHSPRLPFPLGNTGADVPEFPWFALHVRSKCEVMASRVLEAKGFPVYLPLHRTRRQWSDRTKECDTPLFTGYTFCRFDPRHKLPILNTAGVASILQSPNGPIPVDEAEIEGVRRLLNSGLAVGPYPFLHAGDRVLVERGPLSGMEGLIVSLRNKYRLVVTLSLLQRSVSAEIDRGWVRPLPPIRSSVASLPS